ncbi:MAG: CCA tRNA nucleotidyltransferase [Armatimonadetes bacterium]|nr:CCA tRNA nucleotidyltransferase [Armatimonadota bacterium]
MADFLTRITRQLAAVAPGAYFVGGCVRDCLRGMPLKDVDVVLPGDPWAVGQQVVLPMQSGSGRGALFWLREEDRVARIVFPRAPGLQLDLAPLRGSIQDDLRARDFTVNALAIPVLAGLCPEAAVIDPLGGLADLRAGCLRFCAPEAPVADPLRTLRAVRFKHQLGYQIDPWTEWRVRECAPLLGTASRERVRDELFLLLATDTAADGLADLVSLGLWPGVAPDAPRPPLVADRPAPAAFLARFLAHVRQAEEDPDIGPAVQDYVRQQYSAPRSFAELLRWAAAEWSLVGGREGIVDVALAHRIHRSLRLSAKEGEMMARVLTGAAEALALVRRWPVLPRERYRLFRRARDGGPGAVLLAASREDHLAWGALLAEALRRQSQPAAPLVSGRDVMRLLNLKPGPWIGRLLEAVEEERADGRIATPEEARRWLREHGLALVPNAFGTAGAPNIEGEPYDRGSDGSDPD